MKILGTKNNGISGGQYGEGRGRMHHGIDLDVPIGTPVYSMFDSKATFVRGEFDSDVPYEDYASTYPQYKNSPGTLAAGNMIILTSTSGGIVTTYMHMDNIVVSPSGAVIIPAGTLIGYSGNTGSAASSSSNGAHLHLQVKKNGIEQDPEDYLYSNFDNNGEDLNPPCIHPEL